ncbi:MAG: reverse transcriptase family protein [Azonexus sp.]|jgi:hypothetical protein|uniref:reverse transcriptase family protein n=1 Tax=Azonexus sp. TaxID=1872668 RepID=UPI002838F5EC|nr:reverse transcriptase family protein [Azonexus sp.]MDR0776685.1 reverse transcriptase family protein [Azonexus sp.]
MSRRFSHARSIATALAHALLAADVDQARARSQAALTERMSVCLGIPAPAQLRTLAIALARRSLPFWRRHTVPTLARHLQDMASFQKLLAGAPLRVRRWLLRPTEMRDQTSGFIVPLPLPQWPTPVNLARGLGISPDELDWLCHPALGWRDDSSTLGARRVAPHYRCILRPKASGGLRLIEAPLPLLKRVQRRLVAELLQHVPVHECVHGFVHGRDVASHAQTHAGQPFVMIFDLRDFFNSIGAGRINALWRSLGYPEGVARCLSALTTTRTPTSVLMRLHEAGETDSLRQRRLSSAHLPQGAPTSPALANLCTFGLDLRLAGLAERFGARYSRYADDLVFSGPAALNRQSRALHAWVSAIAASEGFALHPTKTRRLPAHRQQCITGLVINQRPNLARDDYDRLRAELHQLSLQTAVDPALRAHLQGRLAWAARFVCDSRARKLAGLLGRINFVPALSV